MRPIIYFAIGVYVGIQVHQYYNVEQFKTDMKKWYSSNENIQNKQNDTSDSLGRIMSCISILEKKYRRANSSNETS